MRIYLLQVECYFDKEEHYENVYSTKDKAIKEGKERLEKIFKKQYKSFFEDDDEENETDALEEDEEETWYEEIQNAVGVKALKALRDICQQEGDVDMDIFDDIPDV